MRQEDRFSGFWSAAAVLIMVVLASGCSPGQEDRSPVVAHDSAGVWVVESTLPVWVSGDEWIVASMPGLDIGPEYNLYQARAGFRLPDGRIVVAHASTQEFLVFGPEGDLLERFGGRGQGPGEFSNLGRVRRWQADSILAVDFPVRASVLAPDGRFVRTFRIPPLPDGRMSLLVDGFSDGRLLVTPAGGPPSGAGLDRRERSLWSITPAGDDARHLVSFPELEQYFFESTPPRPLALRRPFFGHTAYYVAGGGKLFWGSTERFEIRVHRQDGTLERVFRRSHEPRFFHSPDVEDLIEATVPSGSDSNLERSWRRILRELPSSGAVPAWGWPDYGAQYGPGLQLDDEGYLWVVEYYMPGEERNARSVFSPDGMWLGSVELPPRFTPWHIGEDFMLGRWRDDLDVEHVRLYALARQAG